MRDFIQTMWLRLFVLAAGKMGFRFLFPYEKDMVIHVAISETALLSSMREFIDAHEAEAEQRRKKAFAEVETVILSAEEFEDEEEEEEEEKWTKEDWKDWRADDHINDGEKV